MKKGIGIARPIPIWISDGLELAGPPYGANGYVPRNPWRLPREEEKAQLFATGEPRFESCVDVVKLPKELFQEVRQMGLGRLPSLEAFIAFVQTPSFKALERKLAEFAHSFSFDDRLFQPLPPTLNRAGLRTTTFDGGNRCFLGMHLDSWDRLPFAERGRASNRMSINLGDEDRYLLFMNGPIGDLVAELPEKDRAPEVAVTNVLKHNLDEPVIKVRVAPGEAYIAPTENILHDGSTEGMKGFDVHLTVRGFLAVGRA